MIDSASLHPLLADWFSRIDWDMRKQFILLGDLASIVPILPHMLPKSSLTGLITARRKGKKINPPLSLHVYLTLCASDNATEMDISAYELSEFYGHFLNPVSMKRT
jgi:hypothetical protein